MSLTTLLAVAIALSTASPAASAPASPAGSTMPMRFDFLVSAGHEGRPASCARFPKRRCNLGASGEREWTPIVADEVTRVLRSRGFSVAREPADFDGSYDVKAAIFIHFDGNDVPCSTGASIGYHSVASAHAARLWRSMYSRVFPYRFMPDDFSVNLRDYYGFRQVHAPDGALVIELGEVSCPAQRQWLSSRLPSLGHLVADFLTRLTAKK